MQANLADSNVSLSESDVETFVKMRNVFAFLTGQHLVATRRQSTLFVIFLRIADVLQRYEFSNLDGSTLGEDANTAISHCVRDYNMADVRSSREKTIEAVVLGEKMKYWPLYNEGFVHAIGKYEDIIGLNSSKFNLISETTRKRMERSTLDLTMRLRNVRTRLEDFDFPALFAGFANSTTSSESKVIRFKAWKSAYTAMRRYVITYYKSKFGSWPPKAHKKNNFEESGLNRLLLRDLYSDFSDLYDILVDRTSMTTRHTEVPSQDAEEPDEPTPRALRRILSEYDRSVVPVQPPAPFDIPLIPSLSSTRRKFDTLDHRKQKKESMKRLATDEINQALLQASNRESLKSSSFILSFLDYERHCAQGKSMEEIADVRIGQWIFLYVVLQALPLVVIDAPGLQFTQTVEYFLCEVPLGGAPWVQEASHRRQSWFGIAGSSGLVSLPAHVVEHGVDGIYHRSHCWTAAEEWLRRNETSTDGFDHETTQNNVISPTVQAAPPTSFQPPNFHASHSRNSSGFQSTSASNSSPTSPHTPLQGRRRSSALNLANLGLGLEHLPLPQGVMVSLPGADGSGGSNSSSQPLSSYDPTKNFDAILAGTNAIKEPGKGKKK